MRRTTGSGHFPRRGECIVSLDRQAVPHPAVGESLTGASSFGCIVFELVVAGCASADGQFGNYQGWRSVPINAPVPRNGVAPGWSADWKLFRSGLLGN